MPTMPEATAALDIRSLNTKFNEMVKFIQSAAGDELAIHKGDKGEAITLAGRRGRSGSKGCVAAPISRYLASTN